MTSDTFPSCRAGEIPNRIPGGNTRPARSTASENRSGNRYGMSP